MKGSFQREERSIGKMQRNKMTANTGGMVCYIIYYYFMKVFLVIFFLLQFDIQQLFSKMVGTIIR